MVLLLMLAACKGHEMKDGIYKALSSKDERGAYGEITITIKDDRITDCEFLTWQENGKLKDENYGKSPGSTVTGKFYKKAQVAVAAMKSYADELVKSGDPARVDVISGATISHGQFQEAAKAALGKARSGN